MLCQLSSRWVSVGHCRQELRMECSLGTRGSSVQPYSRYLTTLMLIAACHSSSIILLQGQFPNLYKQDFFNVVHSFV